MRQRFQWRIWTPSTSAHPDAGLTETSRRWCLEALRGLRRLADVCQGPSGRVREARDHSSARRSETGARERRILTAKRARALRRPPSPPARRAISHLTSLESATAVMCARSTVTESRVDNPSKAEPAGFPKKRTLSASVPDVDAYFTLQHGLQRLRLPPFSILVCTKCKTSWPFDANGRVVGPEFRSPCECGSTQFVLPRRAAPG